MKKYAIIGLGFIAPRHIQAIQKTDGTVSWGCDIDITKAGILPEWSSFTVDYRDIDKVDCVVICTPNDLHIPIAKHFRSKDIEVLTEKPPAIEPNEMLEGWRHPDDVNGVNVVLQLRTHPEVLKLKESLDLDKCHTVTLDIRMKRGESYWNGWKGEESRSGGILFNLGVHYLDLLLFLFGNDYSIIENRDYYDTKGRKSKVTGKIKVGNSIVDYNFEILDDTEESNLKQSRRLKIDDHEVELSNKDNLSYEDLHTNIYKLLDKGEAVKLKDCKTLLELIKQL